MLKDFQLIKQQLFSTDLPMHKQLFDLCEECSGLLENEITDYREAGSSGQPGGLLDFTKNPLPTIIVPDIHARPQFIYNILKYRLPESIIQYSDRSVFHALKKGLVRIICVGDALHTEKTMFRWSTIQEEFNNHKYTGPSMSEEMLEGFNTICALMKLKSLFPKYVHFLKGNHENIMNRTGEGDYGFRKYADEGAMVRKFIFEMYGDDILYLLSCIENSLPVICLNQNYIVSHAEPENAYSREEYVNARENPVIVEDLTWTNNGDAKEGSVLKTMENLYGTKNIENCLYFGGHRPVPEDYLLRQNGLYVQIHNPSKQNILFILPEKKINLDEDIIHLDKIKKGYRGKK